MKSCSLTKQMAAIILSQLSHETQFHLIRFHLQLQPQWCSRCRGMIDLVPNKPEGKAFNFYLQLPPIFRDILNFKNFCRKYANFEHFVIV